jgi:hypothetical protein
VIVDAFLYAGETDMLELRVRTLGTIVDLFVPVICARTHQGDPVDLPAVHESIDVAVGRVADAGTVSEFGDRRRRGLVSHGFHFYATRWSIAPYVVNPEPIPDGSRGGAGSRWYQFIERQHRDGIVRACDAAAVPADAVVCVSDVDEIPDPRAIAGLRGRVDDGDWFVLEQRFHSTALDLLHPQQPWLGTTVTCRAALEPQRMRDARGDRDLTGQVSHGGWHLSWFGTDVERSRKLDSFSHAELRDLFDPAAARQHLVHANGEQLRHLHVGEIGRLDWPAPIVDGSFPVPDHWWICPPPGRLP